MERSISHWGIHEVEYDWLDGWSYSIYRPEFFTVQID